MTVSTETHYTSRLQTIGGENKMVICEDCEQEMTDPKTITCKDVTVEFPDGTKMQRIPYAEFIQGIHTATRCHDCNIDYGGYHHLGCCMEMCPKCDNQLITCGCLEH